MRKEWASTKEGAHLAGRKRYDTEPEMLLRRALHAMGCRYRTHVRLAPACRPDILFPRARVAVFVDGDFWHGCPRHGRVAFRGPNAQLWVQKLARNRERDREASRVAVELGFEVLRFWECDVREDPDRVAQSVLALLHPRAQAGNAS